ncbi:hypothetical protein F5Y10DRAFT_243646 [Nemania abortiva]|nr:hypothetical protein F5Y10DRAFT_243646 [Nemania abortiva]
MTIPKDGNRPPRQFQAAAYHITSCAAAGQPPPVGAAALEYSHLCHRKRCVEPSHGTCGVV